MPCDVHGIFYSGCGHVLLAASGSEDPEAPASHDPPAAFQCNMHIPHTINISEASCPECGVFPVGFEEALFVDPKVIDVFDKFHEAWAENVADSETLEEDVRSAMQECVKQGVVRKSLEDQAEEDVKPALNEAAAEKRKRRKLSWGRQKWNGEEDEVDWDEDEETVTGKT
jgi:hypothetical protein